MLEPDRCYSFFYTLNWPLMAGLCSVGSATEANGILSSYTVVSYITRIDANRSAPVGGCQWKAVDSVIYGDRSFLMNFQPESWGEKI